MYFWPERQKFAISAETAQFWGFGIGPATRQPLIRIPAEASHRESLQGASLSSTGFTASQSIFYWQFPGKKKLNKGVGRLNLVLLLNRNLGKI